MFQRMCGMSLWGCECMVDRCSMCGAKTSRDNEYIFYIDAAPSGPYTHLGTYHDKCFYIMSGITAEEFFHKNPEIIRYERGHSNIVSENLWDDFVGV